MKRIVLAIITLLPIFSFSQNYTSYFTGNATDIITSPLGGVCVMGGATEDDNAMKWFLQRANGGDVLVLRTSGSNGYNAYMYSGLGVPINSVETIVCNNALASTEAYIIQKIQQAEAVWFAGGDQWTYISYWRNTAIDSAINQAIQQRHIVIGGTSAGMAIQGKYYFSAQNGTVTSASALTNPYNSLVTVDSSAFIKNQWLQHVITDTHFDNPDRKGRLITFLARIKTDYGVFEKAIACDEYAAVCIDTNGMAHVYGGFPTYDDNAYFIQANCELSIQTPENCSAGNPLTWNLGGLAVKAYQIKGDSTGNKTFNLNNWQSGNGGTWYNWYVVNGSFSEQSGVAINCSPLSVNEQTTQTDLNCYPNPTENRIAIQLHQENETILDVQVYDMFGRCCLLPTKQTNHACEVDLSTLPSGIYRVLVRGGNNNRYCNNVLKK